jgi:hypothetical protein
MTRIFINLENDNYALLVDKIKISHNKTYYIGCLKNKKPENFEFDEKTKLWYFNNYTDKKRLIDIIYPAEKILSFGFKNNDPNDYQEENLIIKYKTEYTDLFPEPKDVRIL